MEEIIYLLFLSSMNLELYDEWKDTDAVKLGNLLPWMLFIWSLLIKRKATSPIYRVQETLQCVPQSLRFRCIRIPFLSAKEYDSIRKFQATQFNARAFRHIKEQAEQASERIG